MVSIGANLVLLGLLLTPSRREPPRPAEKTVSSSTNTIPTGSTNIVVRRQLLTWNELESDDYSIYIANLRDIGCPEQTIRDIIIADVNALYARRKATELITPDQQWWRSQPDTNVLAAANQKSEQLDNERRALLTNLLGPGWEGGDLASLPRPSRTPVQLDGPLLGHLPIEINQAVQNIAIRSQERLENYVNSRLREGKEVDLAEYARLQQQTRDELANVLTPPQLEEFLLRYSSTAVNLRARFAELQFFNPTPEEFRSMFRSVSNLDHQIALLSGATDANSVRHRQTLEQQRENSIRAALGPRRYEEYRLLQDDAYRESLRLAQQNNAPDSTGTLYELNVATRAEEARIRLDPTLTPEQREIELKRIELERLRANAVAMGQELPVEQPSTASQSSSQATQPQRRNYTVRRGDNLAVISMMHGVPQEVLRAANPNVNFNRLRGGETLNIPPALTPPVPR